MALDYGEIRNQNQVEYGTAIGRIGDLLLRDIYDDRTHFIFEILQNTEDALARREEWTGSRAVRFDLTDKELHVRHFGKPFDEKDVKGICAIAKSTKTLNDIGRFGIGFKSVYAFTTRPEIHSGSEDFAIESYVMPVSAPMLDRCPIETLIVIPFQSSNEFDHMAEVATALEGLDAPTLLFLTQIEEIHWSVAGARSGLYRRESNQIDVDEGVRLVKIFREEDEPQIEIACLVFLAPGTD